MFFRLPNFCHMCSHSPWYVAIWCTAASKTQTLPSADCFTSPWLVQQCCTTQHCACWHLFNLWHVLHDVCCSSCFCFLGFGGEVVVFLFPLATVSSILKTGAMVKASHCRQMLFSIWHDASSRSHFHCDCRAPSESIDNPCQALAPPTGAGTASKVGTDEAVKTLWHPEGHRFALNAPLNQHCWLSINIYRFVSHRKEGKMGFETQKACLKILAVCCYNRVLNADLALFKVGFYKPVCLCVGKIQCALCKYTSVIVQAGFAAWWLHL